MSARPQVTITLGRSGQVVKRERPTSDVSHPDDMPSSAGKRPVRERLGSNMDNSDLYGSQYKNKRQRTNNHILSLGNGDLNDGKPIKFNRRVGQDDLRLKLLNKSLSHGRDVDLREKLSRSTHNSLRYDLYQHVPDSRASGPAKRIPPTRSADDLLRLDSVRNSYSLKGLRHRSPDRLAGASRGMSPPRNYDELRYVPPVRSIDASRPSSLMTKNVTDASRPMPCMSKATVPADTAKPVARAPPPGAIVPKSPSVSEEPLTVSSLLHSLGLGKYAILFQVEEVDMTALRQMGDSDLKELGIPMGPRKKILLAVLAHSKQRHR
ncbi:protein bicaudal C homolog 1 isoform X2 [Phoenix dactylifera]|uniref:Protein bicaudal C homolog 1 isoform X2 n=1 Tax=Phoenix dactylifera TaxID=42345 RepID=A0A8B7C8E9_PHODC|nr:protein bicaudal C homolog 1 isoform X2 [Phoenix dactylifera]